MESGEVEVCVLGTDYYYIYETAKSQPIVKVFIALASLAPPPLCLQFKDRLGNLRGDHSIRTHRVNNC